MSFAVRKKRTSSHRIDLGLAVLSLRKDRRPRTLEEIAAYCDCHNTAIDKIEKRALKKLRRKLRHISEH